MSIFTSFQARYESTREEEMSIQEYLDLCKSDPMAYATSAERLLQAIGEPELVDTRLDPRLSRIFSNKMIKIYPAFRDFYGMEESIENIVSYFRHAAVWRKRNKSFICLAPSAAVRVRWPKSSRLLSKRYPSMPSRVLQCMSRHWVFSI